MLAGIAINANLLNFTSPSEAALVPPGVSPFDARLLNLLAWGAREAADQLQTLFNTADDFKMKYKHEPLVLFKQLRSIYLQI